MKNFEMANADNLEEVILATQRSLTTAMLDVVQDLKKETKQPGLTWEQIEYFIAGFKDRKPTIITQTNEM